MTPESIVNPRVREYAARELPKLARRYLRRGRDLVEETVTTKADWEALHRFRIESKRFRYTLELFAPVYDAGLQNRIESLKRIQDVLGEINDCQTVLHMKTLRKETGVREWLKQRRSRLLIEFHRTWRQEFEDADATALWIDFLRDHAAEKGTK